MAYSINDFFKESGKHLSFFDGQLKDYENLINQGTKNIAHLDAQRLDIIRQMIEVVAPTFSSEELTQMGKMLNKTQLSSLAQMYEKEVTNGKVRLAEIESDKEYIEREILIDEKTGDYVVEFNQLNAVYEKIDEEFAPYKKYTFEFEDLIKDRYGMDDYEHTGILRFFNNEHLDNWRIGDILCERFACEDFLVLKEAYLKIKKEHAEMFEAVNHYRQKINYIQKLIKEHAELTERLPNLPEIYRQKLVVELDNFLNSTSEQSAAAFFGAYPNLENLLKKQQGLNYQRKYLVDFQNKLNREKEELLAKRSRLYQETQRYRGNPSKYRYKTWPEAKFKKRFKRNEDWIKRRYTKYEKTNQVIYEFDNYEKAPSDMSNVFWWALITNNKIDGSFSSDVQSYYESNTHDESNYVSSNRAGNARNVSDNS